MGNVQRMMCIKSISRLLVNKCEKESVCIIGLFIKVFFNWIVNYYLFLQFNLRVVINGEKI